jgi:hypothetical protein
MSYKAIHVRTLVFGCKFTPWRYCFLIPSCFTVSEYKHMSVKTCWAPCRWKSNAMGSCRIGLWTCSTSDQQQLSINDDDLSFTEERMGNITQYKRTDSEMITLLLGSILKRSSTPFVGWTTEQLTTKISYWWRTDWSYMTLGTITLLLGSILKRLSRPFVWENWSPKRIVTVYMGKPSQSLFFFRYQCLCVLLIYSTCSIFCAKGITVIFRYFWSLNKGIILDCTEYIFGLWDG